MPQTVEDTFGDYDGGYKVQTTSGGNIRLEKEMGAMTIITPAEARDALDTIEGTYGKQHVNADLYASADRHFTDGIAIFHDDDGTGEDGHVVSLPKEVLEDAISAAEAE